MRRRWLGLSAFIRGPADQNEAPVAIATIDIAALVNFEKHARMAERSAARNVGGAITNIAF